MLYTKYKVIESVEVDPLKCIGYNIYNKHLYKMLLDPIPPRFPIYIYYGNEPGFILKCLEESNKKYLLISTENNWEKIRFLNNPPINDSCYPITHFREQLWKELSSLENPNLQIIDWYITSINNLT